MLQTKSLQELADLAGFALVTDFYDGDGGKYFFLTKEGEEYETTQYRKARAFLMNALSTPVEEFTSFSCSVCGIVQPDEEAHLSTAERVVCSECVSE
jgi:hypothetical protein